jgi:hypothetical protein
MQGKRLNARKHAGSPMMARTPCHQQRPLHACEFLSEIVAQSERDHCWACWTDKVTELLLGFKARQQDDYLRFENAPVRYKPRTCSPGASIGSDKSDILSTSLHGSLATYGCWKDAHRPTCPYKRIDPCLQTRSPFSNASYIPSENRRPNRSDSNQMTVLFDMQSLYGPTEEIDIFSSTKRIKLYNLDEI